MPQANLFSINVSQKKGVKKTPVRSVLVVKGEGFSGDAHSGYGHRQVSLLSLASIKKMQQKGAKVGPGDFAENLTVQGMDVAVLPIGEQLRLGDEVLLEVTQIGKECHDRCEIYKQVGDCVMPREGIFAKVVRGGKINRGDSIFLVQEE